MAKKISTMVTKAVTEQVGLKRKHGDGETHGSSMMITPNTARRVRSAAPPADDDDYRVFLSSTPTIVVSVAAQESIYQCQGLNPNAVPWTGGGWLKAPKEGGASAVDLPEPLAVTTPSGSDKPPSSSGGADAHRTFLESIVVITT